LAGQSETVVLEWDTAQGRLHFPHALYANGENTLPYFSTKIPWTAEGMLPRVSVVVQEAVPLAPGTVWQEPSSPAQGEPLLEYSLVREAGRSFVLVRVLPFIAREGGGISRVTRFRLETEQEMALAPLKSHITGDWREHSVLASGSWFKVAVDQSGIYRLSFEQLQEMGMGNPASVRIFGQGARLLPERFSEDYADDLNPVPVYLDKGSDGLFGPGDHVLFYAEGPVGWTFDEAKSFYRHKLHDYSWKGYYFLTDSQGPVLTPGEADLSSDPPGQTVTQYDYRTYFEEETYNLINSGREWYGDIFNVSMENNYPFRLPGRVSGEALRIRVAVAARSGVTSGFQVQANSQYLGSISLDPTDLSYYAATYAHQDAEIFSYQPGSDDVTLTLVYNRPDANSEGWLNQLTLNGRCRLSLNGVDQLEFRDHRTVGAGQVTRFQLEKGAGSVIWEISDPSSPLHVAFTPSGEDAVFTMATDRLYEFIAFRPGGDYPSPDFSSEGLGALENQDLHGLVQADLVIIAPEEFLEAANSLAEHREEEDGLAVEVVSQEQVFNEFSSGTPDVTAIRNFMKMFYDRSGTGGDACRYLLLFGDGSYDNRSTPGKKDNPNRILTYQSENSLAPTQSYVSDDYFGLLDTDESMYNGLLDIGIGRLPVSTVEEAEDMVAKITGYSDVSRLGSWRNQLCFIGDDENGNLHMQQADGLATYVKDWYPDYNINKIYLDAYPQEKGATGERYPDVVRAINDQVNRGALIVNYTGHGGPAGLAHEQVVTLNDINTWNNANMLPLFVTATCEFSRYDEYDQGQDQEETSAGEKVLLNTGGGGIGLFSTTRLVYSAPNSILNERFYELVFEKDTNQQHYRLGDIIAYSKNNTGPGINKRNFTLLGDPSMRLAYPRHRVMTDTINGYAVGSVEDTLSAFDWVSVSGHLESAGGEFMGDFNGEVYPTVFDKERTLETLSNNGDPAWSFLARNNILYSGKATVRDGRFSFGFYVPKDINYSFGSGKISYYSHDSLVDAHGSCESFQVGGIGSENALDLEPPVVELFMNDTHFVSGGITDTHPILLVQARDNFGINTTGNGIGHDLTATLDGDRVNALILNEFFQANTDSYNSGSIRYPYSMLEAGEHEITVKIWDIHNNSTESSVEFLVVDSEEMLLEQLFNYPNPFSEQTLFNIEHNRPDRELRLVLSIHDLSGKVVRIIDRKAYSAGYRLEPVPWDGTSESGARLGAGVYLYRATLSTEDGEEATSSGKLLFVR
jgi:hypothetical protein